ncbi:hypothetical protein LR48_Vigan05g130200 [Vigna angularis]|uniref:Uncharacterized protein n=1 Tax=Phaseolus angularis TaxID=3914 RepID=A0A0L9UMA1_PHAAN|nr:hypothetical protein LR48_Vigan05g130200 [Vigna angularis]
MLKYLAVCQLLRWVSDSGGICSKRKGKSDEVDEVGKDGEGKVAEHGEDQVGEDGEEELVGDGDKVAEVGEHDEHEVDDVGEDGEGKLAEHDEHKVGEDGQEEVVEDGYKVPEVDDVGDGEDDVSGGVRDGQDDVGVGVGDEHDEFDVSSWIGSDEDASVNEDDFVDVRVHGDEQPQEEHYEGSLFVEVGTRSGCTTPNKHV